MSHFVISSYAIVLVLLELANFKCYVSACERGMLHKYLIGRIEERDHLKDQGVDERVVFKYILRKWVCRVWAGFMWLRVGKDGELL